MRPAELAPTATGPLRGVRVLDMTGIVFGANATQLLGEDTAALRALIPHCALFATTMRQDGLQRIGFNDASARSLRPNMIYAHGTGYGSDGPYAGEPAYDDPIPPACGLADVLPRTEGSPWA